MKTLIFLLLFATTATAQSITGGNLETGTITLPGTLSDGYYFSLDTIPKNCWGQSRTVTVQSEREIARQISPVLEIYPEYLYVKNLPKPLKWYDFKTYRFKGQGKRAVWIAYAAAGILHGGREAYHAQPNVLQEVFGGADDSWIGPMQWLRHYPNRDPMQKHKPNAFNTFRDYYHFSSTAHTTILVSGAVLIGTSKQPIKYKIADAAIAIVLRSAAASLTYNMLR